MTSENADTVDKGAKVPQKFAVDSLKVKPEKHRLSTGVKIAIVGTTLGLAYGGGVLNTELTNNEFVNAHTLQVDALHPYNLGLHEIASSTFDNAKDSGAIGNNNFMLIDKNRLANINTIPTIPTPKHDINLLAPFQELPPGINIVYEKTFTGEDQSLFGSDETEYAKKEGIKNKITFKNIPINTVIPAPVDGFLEFYARPRVAPEGTIESANFFYKGPDGTIYQVQMGGTPGDLFKPLTEATPYTFENSVDESTLRVEVKRGQPIALTLQSTDLSYTTKGWPSGEIGVGALKTYPTNVGLIVLPDNLGQDKVAILEK